MNVVDESIRSLSQTVLSDARAEAEQLLSEARSKAEMIRKQSLEQAEAERKRIFETATREMERQQSQVTSSAQLNARTTILSGREELLDDVFEKARSQLDSMQQWRDYPEVARALVRDGLIRLRSEAVRIRADRKTQSVLTGQILSDLSKELNIRLEMGEPLEQEVGVILETLDGRRQYNNTLETRLKRVQNSLRAPVYHILMGESQ
jgi:vacuolar-type H+-ATPase subunit E/Vma4